MSFIKTVQKVDAILYHLGYKDGDDYKWSDRDHVLTFKSDDVRKEVAVKIPSELIHAQYPRTIELEDSAPIHVGQIYFFEGLEGNGSIDEVTDKMVTFSVGRSKQTLPKSRFEFGVKNGSIKLIKDSDKILGMIYSVKDTNGLIHRVVARNSDEAVRKVKDVLDVEVKNDLWGNWTSGTVDGVKFEAKVFDLPSKFGINGGRISKLQFGNVIYDRGWVSKPTTQKEKLILESLLKYFK